MSVPCSLTTSIVGYMWGTGGAMRLDGYDIRAYKEPKWETTQMSTHRIQCTMLFSSNIVVVKIASSLTELGRCDEIYICQNSSKLCDSNGCILLYVWYTSIKLTSKGM